MNGKLTVLDLNCDEGKLNNEEIERKRSFKEKGKEV